MNQQPKPEGSNAAGFVWLMSWGAAVGGAGWILGAQPGPDGWLLLSCLLGSGLVLGLSQRRWARHAAALEATLTQTNDQAWQPRLTALTQSLRDTAERIAISPTSPVAQQGIAAGGVDLF